MSKERAYNFHEVWAYLVDDGCFPTLCKLKFNGDGHFIKLPAA